MTANMEGVDLLPCGCPLSNNLYETNCGTRIPITIGPFDTGFGQQIPPRVWCSEGHGWVKLNDKEYAALLAVGR